MAHNDPVTPVALDELVLMIGLPSAPPSLRDMAQAGESQDKRYVRD